MVCQAGDDAPAFAGRFQLREIASTARNDHVTICIGRAAVFGYGISEWLVTQASQLESPV